MLTIFIRTIIIYVTLIAAMRFLGKRQIGQMQLSELVTTFLLSELVSQPLSNAAVPISYAIIPTVTLICLEIFFSFIPTKISCLKKFVDSDPSIIIRKGRVDRREMIRMRMSLEDLLCELHVAGYASPEDIEYAILEQNGKISLPVLIPCVTIFRSHQKGDDVHGQVYPPGEAEQKSPEGTEPSAAGCLEIQPGHQSR